MSIARVYTTKGPVRKDGLKCEKCGDPIRKGVDRRRTFAVGYRGHEHTRCLKAECTPTRAELESSAVASVYDVIDGVDFGSLGSLEDLTSVKDEVVAVLQEVASEYESNEMYEINYDLQERAETLNSAADELEGWEPEGEAPDEDTVDCPECGGSGQIPHDDPAQPDQDCDECDATGEVEADHEESFDEWMDAARESLQEAIDGLELP